MSAGNDPELLNNMKDEICQSCNKVKCICDDNYEQYKDLHKEEDSDTFKEFQIPSGETQII